MKLVDIIQGETYAIKYGSGIEPARVIGFKRPHLSRITGVLVELTWRNPENQPEDGYWVGANRVVELWEDRHQRLDAEKKAEDEWWDEMVEYRDLIVKSLERLELEDVTVRLSRLGIILLVKHPEDAHWLWAVMPKEHFRARPECHKRKT